MRFESRRNKKLIVAFHFQFANQTAWKCDDCRKAGLEKRRQCAWTSEGEPDRGRVIWGRRHVAATRCPKSIITAESMYLLDEFNLWKRSGARSIHTMPARVVDAILILDNELRAEVASVNQERHGQSNRK